MSTRRGIIAACMGLAFWTYGCQNGALEGREPELASVSEEADGVAPAPSSLVEREFWLALAEEPGWHLNEARSSYLDGKTREAGKELEKVAAILNFETRHSHSVRERGLLLASVAELREVSRQLKVGTEPNRGGASLAELDRVAALAFRTIAAHDVTLGRDALEAGDARMSGRYVGETVNALLRGFELGAIPLGNALTADLEEARDAAARLETEGVGSREAGFADLDVLDRAVEELGNVLTERKK